MKYLCIAALALAGSLYSAPPAEAHGSNCSWYNGPYCEFAHNVRHHGYRLPIQWQTCGGWGYPSYPVWGGGTCGIQQHYGCGYGGGYYGGGYGHGGGYGGGCGYGGGW